MSAYYNENDPKAAAWLRELIAGGHIAPGDVDERSIADVRPDELGPYTQCHFFAGIGGWSYALRLAGWPDDRPVWTGSCPCQPFSAAGARRGTDDARHLWPHWRWLIAQRGPATVFGEQVASKDGRAWLAGVRVDLEALGYAVGGADLCAAGAGAPHIRQRLWWVADALSTGRAERGTGAGGGQVAGLRGAGGVADSANADRWSGECGSEKGTGTHEQRGQRLGERCTTGGVADSHGRLAGDRDVQRSGQHGQQPEDGGALDPWRDGEWIPCSDGRYRRIESGSFPLAHGVPARVGRLRGYGNAIVPQVAAEFIGAYLDVRS